LEPPSPGEHGRAAQAKRGIVVRHSSHGLDYTGRRSLTIACAARGFDVDLIVVAAEGGTVWHLTDLLGRSMGNIRENASHQFTIYPEGPAL
jgi:hypothetical protein